MSRKGDDGVSFAKLAEIVGRDPLELSELKLAGKGLKEIPDLFPCKQLRKVDIAGNGLESLDCVSGLREMTWLSAKDNQIEDINPLLKLFKMQILNLGSNKITTLDALRKMEQLKALIANNNKIAQITGIGGCESINTLVLSHNPITEITGIATLKNITKLSLAHCQIRIIPDLRAHQMLEELRLNDNKINVVPDTIDRNPALKVLDLGKNRLHDISDIFKISQCRKLQNLNLLGNTRLVEQATYKDKVNSAMPALAILDGKRLDGQKGGKGKYRWKEGYKDLLGIKEGNAAAVSGMPWKRKTETGLDRELGASKKARVKGEGDGGGNAGRSESFDGTRQDKKKEKSEEKGKGKEDKSGKRDDTKNPFERFLDDKTKNERNQTKLKSKDEEGNSKEKPTKRAPGKLQEADEEVGGIWGAYGATKEASRGDDGVMRKAKKKKVVEVGDGWGAGDGNAADGVAGKKKKKQAEAEGQERHTEGDTGGLADGKTSGLVAVKKLDGKVKGAKGKKWTPAAIEAIQSVKVGMGGDSAWD